MNYDKIPPMTNRIEDAPEINEAVGMVFKNINRIVIGRSENGNCPDIDIPKNPMISPTHAIITWNPETNVYLLEDHWSKTGIRHNDKAVARTEPNNKIILQTGDSVQVSRNVNYATYKLTISSNKDDHSIEFTILPCLSFKICK